MDSIDVFAVLLGAALIVYGCIRLLKRFSMKRRCTERVSGIAVDVDSGRKTDDTGEGLNHYLKFAYLAEGAEYTKEVWITKRQYKTMHRSQELTICYNPLKPKQCYVLEIKFRLLFTLMFIAVGIILILAFL